ncbi:MAG: DsrE family protein [Saprospirales bacterium]|nr:DsrE family protein [Saprospirales bacterium]
MKKLVFIVLTTLIVFNISAKSSKSKSKESVHKIVFQLTTNDTLAHKSLMKQLNNITSVAPTTKIEVVCHGPGLDMLVTGKTIVQEKIKQLKAIGVDFIACEFSIKERNVPIEKIIPEAGFVKAGIIEIVTKQEQGWSYIKSGF